VRVVKISRVEDTIYSGMNENFPMFSTPLFPLWKVVLLAIQVVFCFDLKRGILSGCHHGPVHPKIHRFELQRFV